METTIMGFIGVILRLDWGFRLITYTIAKSYNLESILSGS